ncbi:hypothetical protein CFK38_13890 [Brachybacterium vulturis]|uniref:Uncharacterized protein n=1 Tax=Brachybacterium vulturis TaxID=2017484 RepID=A0A291GR61_9MICO|nr:hypothetical protein [Brachybacterium vulturis]ATG52486.1 hypothetical protein CFK38_13890 [Brachybacterium vulturis]
MSTPASSPRHLPPSGPSTPPGLFGGRQAAKLRAAVSADLLPEERASADALVMTAWLTAAQRARYAPSLRSGPSTEEFAQRLADERRVVLEEGADQVPDELDSAAHAERQARQLPLRLVEAGLLLVAFTLLAVTIIQSIRSEAAGIAERVPEQGPILLAVAVVAGLLAALVGAVATRRRDHLLLGWAVSRPGQLGRGLPLRRPLQGESAGPAVARSLGPALLVGAGVLAIVAGAALLLISPMLGDVGGVSHWAPWLLGGGAAALVAAVLLIYLRSRRLRRIVRRSRAAEWIGPTPQVEEPPAV